jgi:hypothetical protein
MWIKFEIDGHVAGQGGARIERALPATAKAAALVAGLQTQAADAERRRTGRRRSEGLAGETQTERGDE